MLRFGSTIFIGLIGVIFRLYMDICIELGFISIEEISFWIRIMPNLLIAGSLVLTLYLNKESAGRGMFALPIMGIGILTLMNTIILYSYFNNIHIPFMESLMWRLGDLWKILEGMYIYLYFLTWKSSKDKVLRQTAFISMAVTGIILGINHLGLYLDRVFYMGAYYTQTVMMGVFFIVAYMSSRYEEEMI